VGERSAGTALSLQDGNEPLATRQFLSGDCRARSRRGTHFLLSGAPPLETRLIRAQRVPVEPPPLRHLARVDVEVDWAQSAIVALTLPVEFAVEGEVCERRQPLPTASAREGSSNLEAANRAPEAASVFLAWLLPSLVNSRRRSVGGRSCYDAQQQ
jgi:hypothetical protein